MHLDFRQLRNFVALVEQGSFVQAAEAVCLSQSAFSRSIQALEQTVGHPLIDRQSKQLALTLHGQTLLPYARRMQELSFELSGVLRDVDEAQTGEVVFGCGPAPAARLIPRAVAAFHRLLPHVRIAFRVDNWSALREALASGELPFVVADTWQAELDTQWRVQPLHQQPCFFVCHASHPLAQATSVTTAQLLHYPLAAPYLPPGVRKVLATLSQQQDFTPTIQCDHVYALMGILAHSDAISFASEEGFALIARSHDIVKIELSDVPEEWRFMHTRFGIISPMQVVRQPLVEKLTDIIVQTDHLHQMPLLTSQPHHPLLSG